MKRPTEKLERDENGNLRKKGFLSWISNFGYYYKSYLIVIAVAVIFGVVLYFSINGAQADMYLFLVTREDSSLTDEQVNTLFVNAKTYADDFDNDGTTYFVPDWLKLPDDRKDTAYSDLSRAVKDDNVVCFVVDDFGYSYLMEIGALQKLEFFGLTGADEYRVRLNPTGYMKGVNADEQLYLVMKYYEDSRYEDYFISLLTSSVVDIVKDLQSGK
ncbi:MAG: hypothetical protein II727_06245 [Oscillospiraceae bacterium]|nr:hypothetical protein [Oscillospiraceae bacterium]